MKEQIVSFLKSNKGLVGGFALGIGYNTFFGKKEDSKWKKGSRIFVGSLLGKASFSIYNKISEIPTVVAPVENVITSTSSTLLKKNISSNFDVKNNFERESVQAEKKSNNLLQNIILGVLGVSLIVQSISKDSLKKDLSKLHKDYDFLKKENDDIKIKVGNHNKETEFYTKTLKKNYKKLEELEKQLKETVATYEETIALLKKNKPGMQ